VRAVHEAVHASCIQEAQPNIRCRDCSDITSVELVGAEPGVDLAGQAFNELAVGGLQSCHGGQRHGQSACPAELGNARVKLVQETRHVLAAVLQPGKRGQQHREVLSTEVLQPKQRTLAGTCNDLLVGLPCPGHGAEQQGKVLRVHRG